MYGGHHVFGSVHIYSPRNIIKIKRLRTNDKKSSMKMVIMFLILAVIAVGVTSSCKESKPVKTAAELKADSITQAEKDSVKSIADFKKGSIATINKFIKRKVSSDPEFGEVLETEDKILNDSIYFAVSRIVWKNRYGAKEQHDEF